MPKRECPPKMTSDPIFTRPSGRSLLRVLRAAGGIAFAVAAYLYLSLPDVRLLAATNPKTTAFMDCVHRRGAADRDRQVVCVS